MFMLNEEKFRAAFAKSKEANEPEGYGWVGGPFDPISIDADDLHRIVDDCLGAGHHRKGRPSSHDGRLPASDRRPGAAVVDQSGSGPMLLDGEVVHGVSEKEASTPEERSVIELRAQVEDANALYASLEALIEEAQRPLKDIVRLAGEALAP